MTEQPVVELYHLGQTAPIVVERNAFVAAEIVGGYRAENVPIATSETIDRLLDITDDKYSVILVLRHGIFEKRQEVVPLLQ